VARLELPARLVFVEHGVEHEHGQSTHDQHRGNCGENIEGHEDRIGQSRILVDRETPYVARAAICIFGTGDPVGRSTTLDARALRPDAGNPGIPRRSLDEQFVDVAPAPIFPGLERLNDRVIRLVEVLRGVLVFRAVATSDVSAGKTTPQVDPGIAHFKAFLAAFAAGFDVFVNFFEVFAILRHSRPPSWPNRNL
jgi:hypothetical protein